MIDITFLGQLVATLASAGAFLAFAGVLGAAAYVLSTAAMAIERLPGAGVLVVRGQTPSQNGFSWTIGTIAGALSFVLTLATLRVGGVAGTLVFAFVIGALARSSVALVSILGGRVGARMARGRMARAKALVEWRKQKAAEANEANRKRLLGEDLSSEVTHADAALGKLRQALDTLINTRTTLGDKLKTALESGGNVSLVADMVRMRDDMDARIELGKQVLVAAEAAVARLAYSIPVKKLVRRRPTEISGLDPQIPGDYAARIDLAMTAIDSYIVVIGKARAEIDSIETERPIVENADAGESLPVRARREIDAITSAYVSLRERADLVRLGLRAREGMAQVASAAGEVSIRADGRVDPRDVNLLLDDVARANQTTAADFIGGDEHVQVLAAALARGAKALSGGDRVSLGEVVEALQSMG
jgi:hypothetical protein